MRFFHLSDLHLGKWVNGFSMLDEQQYWIVQLLELVKQRKPHVVLIAGDVYDRRIPPAEAVTMLDGMLTALAEMGILVLVISGNHDSPERLSFGRQLMKQQGIHFAGKYDGTVQKVLAHDAYGAVQFFLLPYVNPQVVHQFLQEEVQSYEEAVRLALSKADLTPGVRSVLLAHQFVTFQGNEPEHSDSEELSLGGLDQVDASVFGAFQYVALGHIHGPQQVGAAHIRYAGSPLCYSFSECRRKKYVTEVEMDAQGHISIQKHTLLPLHPMRELRGSFKQVISDEVVSQGAQDYVHITLTDDPPIVDAIGKVRAVYPNVMKLDFSGYSDGAWANGDDRQWEPSVEDMSPSQLLSQLYQLQYGHEVPQEQLQLFMRVLEGKEKGG